MEMLAKTTMQIGGQWIECEDRNPEKYGKYHVIRQQGSRRVEDEYLWNGSYWVTGGGSPSQSVRLWYENPEEGETPAVPALSLAEYEARIHLYKEQIGTGYIGIGKTLIEAKEAKVVPHGQWEAWVTKTTGLTPRQAQRCMQAATEIREGSAMAKLEMSKALLLLGSGLEEDEREAIAERASEEGATVKALREEIQQARAAQKEVENQLRAREEAHREQLEAVKEDAYRRGEGAGKLEAAETYREEINDLKERAEMNHRARINEIASMNEREKEQKNKIYDLQSELEEQKNYAANLLKELEAKGNAAPDADREILLQAAAEAEQRAADAEAELEALKAGGAGQPEPVWKVLKVAMTRFMTDCEMMPLDPAAMAADKVRIEANLTRLEKWADMMRIALAGVVPAEGAVE